MLSDESPGSSAVSTLRAVDAEYCGACGRPLSQETHAACTRLLAFDPPRFCATCGFRLDVQVFPDGYRAACRKCQGQGRAATKGAESALIAEQVAYYRERAPEYDRMFEDARADPGIAAAFHGLCAFVGGLAPRGAVLELACGTGQWTPLLLVPPVTTLTAVDAAPETLAIHARRADDPRVRRVEADLFDWRPDRRYDLVFFGFWLSHVPPARFADFWSLVDEALARGGTVAFMDNSRGVHGYEHWLGDAPTVQRTLTTGSTYRVVKVLHDPATLVAELHELGWDADVNPVGEKFLTGTARRTPRFQAFVPLSERRLKHGDGRRGAGGR